jgi:hypothetical protein
LLEVENSLNAAKIKTNLNLLSKAWHSESHEPDLNPQRFGNAGLGYPWVPVSFVITEY